MFPHAIEGRLRAALDRAIEQGMEIRGGRFGVQVDAEEGKFVPSSQKKCCALAALAITESPHVKLKGYLGSTSDAVVWNAALALGTSTRKVQALMAGFDNPFEGEYYRDAPEEESEMFQVGQRLAKRYVYNTKV